MSNVLVGRERPLRVLDESLAEALAGRGGLVLVAGEAGIGKTTLLVAAGERAAAASALVLHGTGWDGAGAPSCWPWIQVVRDLRRSVDPAEWERCERAAGPGVGRLLGEVDRDPTSDGSFVLLDAVSTLLVTASRVTPVAIVVDDLHWTDPLTLQLLHFLVRQIPLEAVFVIAAYRDTEVEASDHPLRAAIRELETAGTLLRLGGLETDAVAQLLEREVGATPSAEEVEDLRRRTGGNPFFLQQTAHLWGTTGSTAAVPPGVQVAIERRLARLPSSCIDALSTASLLGTQFDLELLAGALQIPRAEADALLAPAHAAGLTSVVDDQEARFIHDLVRESLVAPMDADEARQRHAAIFDALLERAGPYPAPAGRLAHHAQAAVPKVAAPVAVHHLRAAATDASRRLATDESLGHLTRCLSLLADDDPARAEALLELGAAQQRAGLLGAARQTYLDVAERTGAERDSTLFGRAVLGLHELGDVLLRETATKIELLLADANERVRSGDVDPSVASRLMAAASRSLSHQVGADRDRCDELSAEAVTMARACGDDAALGFCLLARHDALWREGTAPERLALMEEMALVARRAGDEDLRLQAQLLHVVGLLELGDPRAVDEHRALVADAEQSRLPRHRYAARSRSGMMAMLMGDLSAAREHVDQARVLADAIGEVDGESVWVDQRWELARLTHDPRTSRQLVDALRSRGDPHVVLIEVGLLLDSGDPAAAIERRDEIAAIGGRWPTWARAALLAVQAELAASSQDLDWCREIRREIEPIRSTWAVLGGGVLVRGPLSHWAALLDTRCGDLDAAIEGFGTARAAAERLGARPWIVQAQLGEAAARLRRGADGDHSLAAELLDDATRLANAVGMPAAIERAESMAANLRSADPPHPAGVFRLEGDVWHLSFRDRTVRLPNAKGLHDLHTLLAHPAQDISAVVLLDPTPEGDEARASLRLGGDPTLDEEARRRFAARLTELDDAIDAALSLHKDARAATLEREREALLDELRRATGLGGRSRRLGDEHERARKTVTARVRDTLRRLDTRHPELAAHLRSSVTTGASCRYLPDAPVRWLL